MDMKTLMNSPYLIGAALLAVSVLPGSAALLVHEPFDYGTQTNTTKFLRGDNDHNGGIGWADEWKAVSGDPESTGGLRLDLSEVTQSYPAGTDLVGSGGRIENDFGAGESRRQFSSSLGSTSYFSALINWTTGGDFSIQMGNTTNVRWTPFSVNTVGELRTGADDVTGTFGFGAGFVQLTSGTDYLVVARRTSVGSDRTLVASVFEVGSPGSFLTEPVSWDLTKTITSGVALSHLDVDADSGTTGIIDEIRIGDTYADVVGVPEPQSMILVGLAGMSLMMRRRR